MAEAKRRASQAPDWLASLWVPVLLGLICLGSLLGLVWARYGDDLRAPTAVLTVLLGGGWLWSLRRIRLAWVQRRRLLADRPEELAVGAGLRAGLLRIGVQHLAFNLLALVIVATSVAAGAVLGEFAGRIAALALSAPLFLVFPFLLARIAPRLHAADRSPGYPVLLGFVALWLSFVASMQAMEAWRLQRAEVLDPARLADMPALHGRNLLFGAENARPAPGAAVRSYGWSKRHRIGLRHYRVYAVPLVDVRDSTAAIDLDTACVWLGIRHDDSPPGAGSATRALDERVRDIHARRLRDSEPRWLREVHWEATVVPDEQQGYRLAVAGRSDAERGCTPLILRSVAPPQALRAAAWWKLAASFGIANLLPLLLLLGYGVWRLDRLGRDEILRARGSVRGHARELHPLQRLFQCSDQDREAFLAGRLSRRQERRIRRRLRWVMGASVAALLLLAIGLLLATLLAVHAWQSPDHGWAAALISSAFALLLLGFLVGLPIERWRWHRLTRQDLREGRVERLIGPTFRHMLRRHKDRNDYWVILEGQRFDIGKAVYDVLEDGGRYAIIHLPHSRRLLAILPVDAAMALPPAPRRGIPATALADALHFSAEELAENRSGRIAASQRARLWRGQFGWLRDRGWYAPIMGFAAGSLLIPWIAWRQGLAGTIEAGLFGSLGLALAVWFLTMGWLRNALPRRRDLREGRIETLSGVLRYQGNRQDSDSGYAWDEIYLDDRRLLVDSRLREALVAGRSYRFHLAAHSRQILSVEPVDPPRSGAAKRRPGAGRAV